MSDFYIWRDQTSINGHQFVGLDEAEERIYELEHPEPVHREFPFECPNCGLKANLTIDVTPR
jgi:hypothetical protein